MGFLDRDEADIGVANMFLSYWRIQVVEFTAPYDLEVIAIIIVIINFFSRCRSSLVVIIIVIVVIIGYVLFLSSTVLVKSIGSPRLGIQQVLMTKKA